MTLKLNHDLDILKMTEMKLLGKAIRKMQPEQEKYETALQVKGQISPTSNHF